MSFRNQRPVTFIKNVNRRRFLKTLVSAGVFAGLPLHASARELVDMRRISTNGIELAMYDMGAGPTIVLLHGFPGLAYSWRHQIPALVSAGFRVVVPDLRGYGQSDAPAAVKDYDIQELASDVVGLLDELGIEKAIFMGHDWGGILAWQMPLIHPRRTAGVISVTTPFIPHWMLWLHPDLIDAVLPDGRHFSADPMVDPVEQMREVYSPEMYVLKFINGTTADKVMNDDIALALQTSMRKGLLTQADWKTLPSEAANMEYYGQPPAGQLPGTDVLDAAELGFYVKNFNRTGFTPGINWYRNLSRNWKAGLELDQTIHVPSLMVSAQNDVVLRPSMTEGMERYVKDLQKHVVPNSWHFLPEEKPEEVNQIVVEWLDYRFPAR